MAHHAHSGLNFASTFNIRSAPLMLGAVLLTLVGCAETKETRYMDAVPIATAPLASFTTALGYEVELKRVELALEAQYFTRFGEAHQAQGTLPVLDWAFSTAWAHPGHSQGGEVTGEAAGPSTAVFLPASSDDTSPAPFSHAQLAAGDYDAVDFVFGRLENSPEHSMILEGVALKDDDTHPFLFHVTQDVGRQVIGIPFDATVNSERPLRLHFDGQSRFEVGGAYPTVFDTLDFATDIQWKTQDGADVMVAEPGTLNRLRGQLQKHDYYYYDVDN